jgi:hypothetical protein
MPDWAKVQHSTSNIQGKSKVQIPRGIDSKKWVKKIKPGCGMKRKF